MTAAKDAETARRALLSRPPVAREDYLSTGAGILNLACSGSIGGGIPKGSVVLFVGDSSAGKTVAGLTCLAEAANNPAFDDYQLIEDPVERGNLFDMTRMFGAKLVKRHTLPTGLFTSPHPSVTVEDFYFHIEAAAKRRPFVYLLDSMDALTSVDEQKKFTDRAGARRAEIAKGKKNDLAGSYGMAKAKANSADMRTVYNLIRDTGSILIVLMQTRDKIATGWSPVPQGPSKTHSGGHAPTFYSQQKFWFSIKSHVNETLLGKKRELGILAKVRVEKSRLTGRDRTVTVPIYHSLGVDDLGGLVYFLVDEGRWKRKGEAAFTPRTEIKAPEFDWTGPADDLVRKIEAEGREKELRLLVQQTWNEIEAACVIERKGRYK